MTVRLPAIAAQLAALGALAAAHASSADLADLLVGEFNNNEQVWQQGLDDVAPALRQHWRIERRGDDSLGVIRAEGQSAPDAPGWRLRIDAMHAIVLDAAGADTPCAYRWQRTDAGYRMATEAVRECPADLPETWQVTPEQLVLTHRDGATAYARRVVRYTGWIALQRLRIDPAAAPDDYILIRDATLHDEGFVMPVTDGDQATGYAVELARLTYQNTRTSVLKLGIIDEASGETVSYSWAAPGAERIGINLRWIQAGMTKSTP